VNKWGEGRSATRVTVVYSDNGTAKLGLDDKTVTAIQVRKLRKKVSFKKARSGPRGGRITRAKNKGGIIIITC